VTDYRSPPGTKGLGRGARTLAGALGLAACLALPARAADPGTVQLAIYYGAYGEFVPLRAPLGKATLAQPKILNAVCRTWSYATAHVDYGALPPGMQFENGVISGTPAAPGTWVLSVKFTGILCNGTAFPDQDAVVPIEVK
jgi:hypothetical protein